MLIIFYIQTLKIKLIKLAVEKISKPILGFYERSICCRFVPKSTFIIRLVYCEINTNINMFDYSTVYLF